VVDVQAYDYDRPIDEECFTGRKTMEYGKSFKPLSLKLKAAGVNAGGLSLGFK
jgi:hypothetical protein